MKLARRYLWGSHESDVRSDRYQHCLPQFVTLFDVNTKRESTKTFSLDRSRFSDTRHTRFKQELCWQSVYIVQINHISFFLNFTSRMPSMFIKAPEAVNALFESSRPYANRLSHRCKRWALRSRCAQPPREMATQVSGRRACPCMLIR